MSTNISPDIFILTAADLAAREAAAFQRGVQRGLFEAQSNQDRRHTSRPDLTQKVRDWVAAQPEEFTTDTLAEVDPSSPVKRLYNALSYLARQGHIKRLRYGVYRRANPSEPKP